MPGQCLFFLSITINHEGLGHVQLCYSKHHVGMEVQAWTVAINKSLIILEQSPNSQSSQSHFFWLFIFLERQISDFCAVFLFVLQNWSGIPQPQIEVPAECLTRRWGV